MAAPVGFDRAVWRAEADGAGVRFWHVSPDGDQGFPGTLSASVRYAIEDDAVVLDYEATTDAPTVVGLTNHAYFNMGGGADVLGHELTLFADRFTPTDATQIPTGELRPVAGTAFDFRAPHPVGARIGEADAQLTLGGGYDHNFVLADAPRDAPVLAARLSAAGVTLEVLTTEPGVQFYSGNYLPQAGLPFRAALCLETQHFPDAPNQAGFRPSCCGRGRCDAAGRCCGSRPDGALNARRQPPCRRRGSARRQPARARSGLRRTPAG